LLLAGVPIYVIYSPKKEITELKQELLSTESIIKRARSQEERFLANILMHIKRFYRRKTGKKKAQAENR
jgi:hypothetical protein